MATVTQSSIPEALDTANGILNDRLAILSSINGDLGPPDLVTINKICERENNKEYPTYFYYTGADTSSVSSIAALLNSIASIISNDEQLWFGKLKQFKVKTITFSCYNLFENLDIRILVHLPGKVEWEIFNKFGEIQDKENYNIDDLFDQCYLSSIIRQFISINDNFENLNSINNLNFFNFDEEFQSIAEIRNINPFIEKNQILNFLKIFKKFFHLGLNLPCNEKFQKSSILNNYLIDTFFKIINLTKFFNEGLKILNEILNLSKDFIEVNVLIVKLLFISNNEIDAIKLIYKNLSLNKFLKPWHGYLLILQSKYLIKKGKYDLSLKLSIKSVDLLPTLFESWEILALNYIKLNDFENALKIINSCPILINKDKFILKRIIKIDNKDLHLPTPQEVYLKGISNINSKDISNEHFNLYSIDEGKKIIELDNLNLKTTLRLIYNLIIKIIKKINWKGLLEIRSKVFIIENDEIENNFKIKNKLICQIWLENLFKLLHEEILIFQNFKTKELQFESMYDDNILIKSNNYLGYWNLNEIDDYTLTKSCYEWELLGLLNLRIGNIDDAQKMFERAISIRFSVKSVINLIKIYYNWKIKLIKNNNYKDIDRYNLIILRLLTGLMVWNFKWYSTFSPFQIKMMTILINEIGATKVGNEVRSWFEDYDKEKSRGVGDLVDVEIQILKNWGIVELE